MSWQSPKTNWSVVDGVRADDLNRIEGNMLHLYNNEKGAKRPATLIIGASTSEHLQGAVDYLCDGTNDSAVINAAIAALPESGGKIIILDGEYELSSTLTVAKPNVTIEGCNRATVLNSSASTIIAVNAAQCCIRGLSMIGSDSSSQVGISVAAAATGCSIDTCTFNAISTAVRTSGTYTIISDNVFYNSNLYGVSVQGSYASVKNNFFHNCLISIRTYYVSGAVIVGNTVHASGAANGYGINIIDSDTCVVSNNIVRSAYVGIEVYMYPAGNTFSTVDSNLIIGCNNGIQLTDAHNNSVSCNLVQNETYASNQYSMYISGSNKNAISCNRLIGKTYTEVLSTGNSYAGNLTT